MMRALPVARPGSSITCGAALIICALAWTVSLAQADPTDLARAALLAKDQRQCASAIGLFNEALRQGGFSPKEEGLLIYNRGICHEGLGMPQKALADLSSAIALLPDLAGAYNYRGIVWGELNEYDRAIADFEQAKRLDPENPLVFNNLGNTFSAKGDLDRALANYDQAIKLRPGYAGAFYNRAAVYASRHDNEHAIADYDQAIRLVPNYSDAYHNRGVLKLIQGDARAAIADFEAAIRMNPRNVEALMNLASARLVDGPVDDALADFTHAIEIAPGNALAYLGRGRIALFSGKSAQGTEDFLTAHRLQPTSVYAVLWLHIARLHQGQNDEKEFKENSEKVQRNTWPGLLIGLYDGTTTPAQFRTAAMEGAVTQGQRTCEIDFYLGELEASRQSKDEARNLLTNATNECPRHDINYFAARAEIDWIGGR